MQTVPVNPLPKTPTPTFSPTKAGQLFQKLRQQIVTISKGDTWAQIIEKVMPIIEDFNEFVLVLGVIKDALDAVKSITGIAVDLKTLVNDPEQCVCDALTCLNEILDHSLLHREARLQDTKELKSAILSVASNLVLSAHINRQGLTLDEFGNGQNTHDAGAVLNRSLFRQSAQQTLGPCVPDVTVDE